MNTIINNIKNMMNEFVEYYNTLNKFQKVIFIIVVALMKMGPDFITIPLLLKYIRKKNAERNKADN